MMQRAEPAPYAAKIAHSVRQQEASSIEGEERVQYKTEDMKQMKRTFQ